MQADSTCDIIANESEVIILDAIISLISSVGFPIAACIYLVCTTNKQIEQLTKAVNDMSTAVTTLTMKLESEE